MYLYLVRHGESEANRDDKHAGWAPVHLTEKGISDARRAGRLIEGIAFDKVFSSDLVRVRETCFYATGMKDPELRSELREMSVGELAGKHPADLAIELGESYRANRRIRNYRPYGGEDMNDLYSRVSSFMRMLETKPYCDMERILAFGSEGSIDMALAYVLGDGDTAMVGKVVCSNGSVSVLEESDGRWRVRNWNYTGSI
ncbi:MAG: histidine phosphatase family protein [Candidatus Ornithospirochaeta sp.]|nr:histidine phosphatase family protein [Candidatus Ornithospirochaeta sp.]